MICSYGGITLASDAPEGVANLRVDGRQLNQEVELLRSATVALFPRGNRSTAISFEVGRAFASLLLAEQFVHGHLDELPTSGDLVFTLADGSTTKTYAGALLESCTPVQYGVSVRVAYTFRAKRPT